MIYIIKSGEWYKIGYAANLLKRVTQYGTYNPDVEFIAYGEGDEKIESEIHSILKESKHKYRMEWFLASEEQINFIINKYNLQNASEYNKSIFFTTYQEKKQIACNNMTEETRMKLSEAARRRKPCAKGNTIACAKRRIGIVLPNRSKAILQYSLNGEFIAEHSTAANAARAIGKSYSMSAHIADCCRGKRYTAGGYKWIWKNNS